MLIEDPHAIANKFKEQFNNVGEIYRAKPTSYSDFIKYLPKQQISNVKLKDEMNQVIKSLNTRKCSHDKIPTFLFKKSQ